MSFLLGKKLGMTQIFDENGFAQSTTLVEVGPCTVTQIKSLDKDGYSAAQIGWGSKKLNKPLAGHIKSFINKDVRGFAILREFSTGDENKLKVGDILDVGQFELGNKVNIRGTTKAKGFQGVVKRWNFAGGPGSHGQKHSLRTPGSIGSAFPQHVLKGLKMAGRMGGKKKSVLNLKVLYIDKDKNIIGLRGAVPGNAGKYIELWN